MSPLEELTAYLAHHRSTQDAAKALAMMQRAARESGAQEHESGLPQRTLALAGDLIGKSDERHPGEEHEKETEHADEPAGEGSEMTEADMAVEPVPEDLMEPEDPSEADQQPEEARLSSEPDAGTSGTIELADSEPSHETGKAIRTPAAEPPLPDEVEPSLNLELPKAVRTTLEGLHALTIDLNRLLGTNPPVNNWRRYMNGERDVFTSHLIEWAAERPDALQLAYGGSEEFRKYADRFLTQYAALAEALQDDPKLADAREQLPGTDVAWLADRIETARAG